MRRSRFISVVLGSATLVLATITAAAPAGVGEIVRSSDASLNGITVPERGTVTPGSTLATGEHGSALVQFSPDSQINLLAKTSISFQSDPDKLLARMSRGTIGVRSFGRERVQVETPGYQIGPAAQGGALYVVAMLSDSTTIVSARRGPVSIEQRASGEKYVLSEGHYAKVADDAQPAPPQTTAQGPGAPPPALLGPSAAFLLGVGSGVGIAVVLDLTVLAPPTVSPSSP
ncbi:MAG TPA: hypothetical protein VGZ29_12875 [Terriglobia bacterium]|nr:hypothetical protein [Terriglobia bacterium]